MTQRDKNLTTSFGMFITILCQCFRRTEGQFENAATQRQVFCGAAFACVALENGFGKNPQKTSDFSYLRWG